MKTNTLNGLTAAQLRRAANMKERPELSHHRQGEAKKPAQRGRPGGDCASRKTALAQRGEGQVSPHFPAFPAPESDGMTLLHYFAAHAPAKPADWFQPALTLATIPAKPEGADYCDGCKGDADCDKTEACLKMRAWVDARETAREFNRLEAARAMSSQWPWAWAQATLNAQPRP